MRRALPFTILAALVLGGCAGTPPHPAAAIKTQSVTMHASPAAPPAAAAPAREVFLCHWEAAVSPALADKIRSSGSYAFDSQGYEAYLCDGESLVALLRAGQADHSLLALGDGLEVSSPAARDFNSVYSGPAHTSSSMTVPADADSPHAAPANCVSAGTVVLDVRESFAHLKVNLEDTTIKLGNATRPIFTGSVHYKGNLQPGRAVAFLGEFRRDDGNAAVDLLVWQIFPCRYGDIFRHTMDANSGNNPYDALRKWIAIGPSALDAGFGQDIAWNFSAPLATDHVDSKWVRRLGDGTVIKLLAVSDAYAHPLRWWNPAGLRVAAPDPGQYRPPEFAPRPDERTVALLITDPSANQITSGSGYQDEPTAQVEEHGPFTIAGQLVWPATAPGTPPYEKVVRFAVPAGDDLPLHVGVCLGMGKWTKAGAITSAGPVRIAGCEYILRDMESVRAKSANDPGRTAVTLSYSDSLDHATTFAIVWKDGKQLLLPPLTRQATQMAEPAKELVEYYQSFAGDLSDVDHIEVMTRPMEHVTFDGISPDAKQAVPTAMPPSRPMPNLASVTVAPPAPGTPAAAMAAFEAAGRAGDFKALLAACDAPTAPAVRLAEQQAHLTIAACRLLHEAEVKFGSAEADRTLADDWAINDFGEIGEAEWYAMGNTASNSRFESGFVDIPLLRRVGGVWKLDCTESVFPVKVEQIEAKTRQLQSLAEATRAGKFDNAFDLRDALVAPTADADIDQSRPIAHPW